LESDVEIVAEDPTYDLIASIGGMINSKEFDPDPQLILKLMRN